MKQFPVANAGPAFKPTFPIGPFQGMMPAVSVYTHTVYALHDHRGNSFVPRTHRGKRNIGSYARAITAKVTAVMAPGQSPRDKLLSALAHEPRHIINGVIKITNPATTTSIKRSASTLADLGNLDRLPLELLHLIFATLDVQTLSRITRTCQRGIEVIESLPEYRDLLRHAPQAIAALGSTRLLPLYSAQTLHAALHSSACCSCGDFGPFLLLSTCDRCCYECLSRNQSLWVVPYSEAQKAFDLSAASVKKLPTLHSIPGRYSVMHSVDLRKSHRLVSVRAAKELALAQGKTAEHLAHTLENKRAAGLSLQKYHKLRWISEAPLDAPGPAIISKGTQANAPNDNFCGMAAVPFPYICATGLVERGTWCLGCEKAFRDFPAIRPDEALSHLTASGIDVKRKLYAAQHVARTAEDFLKHIGSCSGSKDMLPDLDALLDSHNV